ncbi:MAG: aminotransferase class I/II-fold pyridoxal phosphate-dependent enzyme [Ilumatobacteraceae bacterium]
MTDLAAEFDAISPEALHAAGHLKWTKFGPGVLGGFVAEMDFGTAPAVRAALLDAIERDLLGYVPPTLVTEMGAACAEWCAARYGWGVDPADVHPLPDVLRGLEMAIQHCSRPGSPVILPVPAYMPFHTIPGKYDRSIIDVAMARDGGRWVYDLDALDAAFAAGGSLLVLCNPHNPLGRVMTPDEMLAIAAVVERHGGRVFSDEIHAPLVYAPHRHVPYATVSPAAAAHTVTATSASKAWNLPGLKCAQLIVSNDADRATMEANGVWFRHGAATIGVVANVAAYREGRDWIDGVVTYLDGNRRLLGTLLADLLPEVGYEPPEGTYLSWLDFGALDLPDHLAAWFTAEAAVAMIDGYECGGPACNGYVRLNFATGRPILEQMVTSMAAAVRRHQQGG